jgi:hypothetical protein
MLLSRKDEEQNSFRREAGEDELPIPDSVK